MDKNQSWLRLQVSGPDGFNFILPCNPNWAVSHLENHMVQIYNQIASNQSSSLRAAKVKSIRRKGYYVAPSLKVGNAFNDWDQITCNIVVKKRQSHQQPVHQNKKNHKTEKQKQVTENNQKDQSSIKKKQKIKQKKPSEQPTKQKQDKNDEKSKNNEHEKKEKKPSAPPDASKIAEMTKFLNLKPEKKEQQKSPQNKETKNVQKSKNKNEKQQKKGESQRKFKLESSESD